MTHESALNPFRTSPFSRPHRTATPARLLAAHLARRRPSAIGLVAAASLLSACGSSAGMGEASSADRSIALSVGTVSAPATIGSLSPDAGRYFLAVEVTLDDVAAPSPIPVGFLQYTLETAEGLMLAPSMASGAMARTCPADTSLQRGSTFRCAVAFEVPLDDAPTRITYDDQHGEVVTAAVSYTAPPAATCPASVLLATACAQCAAVSCGAEENAASMRLQDGETCPDAARCLHSCPTDVHDPSFCSCSSACYGGCRPAVEALGQCLVRRCASACM